MSSILGIMIVLINGLIGFVNREKGLQLYIILSIICPVTIIYGMRVSYEILFFFPMLFLFMMSGVKTHIKKQTVYLTIYLLLFIVATLFSNLLYEPTNELMSIFGIFRMIVLYHMFTSSRNFKESYVVILRVCLYANVIAMILQLILPNALDIFYGLYGKDSATAIAGLYSVGRFTRLTGTFNNSAPAAFFFLVVFATYLVEYSKENNYRNLSILILALLCGFATSTKTFLVGLPILLIANIILSFTFKRKEHLGKRKPIDYKKPILVITAVISVILFLKYTEGILYTTYYINNLSFTTIFSTRYGSDSGNLVDTVRVFKENWLLGVGATTVMDEFVGDSLYVTLLHNTGILGFSIITIFVLGLIKQSVTKTNRLNLLLIMSILMCGTAVPTIFNFFGILTLAFVTINRTNADKGFKTDKNYKSELTCTPINNIQNNEVRKAWMGI
jgi:hypothetical protein